MTRRKGSKLHILLLTGALLLAAGCGTAPEQESPPEEVSAETQAPIYSSNVPLEYLAMANQSSALRMNHDRVHLISDHLLYGKTETWMDENVYYHREDDSRVLVHADDPRFAAVTEDEDGEPAVRYSTSVPEDVVFLSGDFQLLAFSEGETIEEEAEYEGAFHVITRRPAGTDAEFYSTGGIHPGRRHTGAAGKHHHPDKKRRFRGTHRNHDRILYRSAAGDRCPAAGSPP